MSNEVMSLYLELALRTQDYPRITVDHVMVSIQELMQELSVEEARERVQRLRHGTW